MNLTATIPGTLPTVADLEATFVRQHFATLEAEGYALVLPEVKQGHVDTRPTVVLENALLAVAPLIPACTKAPVLWFQFAAPDGQQFTLVLDIEADLVVRICEDADLTHPELFA